jgi:hypothetical protein
MRLDLPRTLPAYVSTSEGTANGLLFSQRIKPSQAWEPGEISVGGYELGLIFNRQRREVGFHREIAGSSEVHQQTKENLGVMIAWRKYLHGRMMQPGAYPADGVLHVHRILQNAESWTPIFIEFLVRK